MDRILEQVQIQDLSIQLTPVRTFDILCWTAEKWDIRRELSLPYGKPSKSLLNLTKPTNEKQKPDRIKTSLGDSVVFEDLDTATGPKVHHISCFYYQRWLKNRTSTTTWHGPYESKEKAWKLCESIAKRTGFQPSEHDCVLE